MINYYIAVPNEDSFRTCIGLGYLGKEEGILIYKIEIFGNLPDEARVIQEPHPVFPHESTLGIETVGDIKRVLKKQMERLKQYEPKIKRKSKTNDL